MRSLAQALTASAVAGAILTPAGVPGLSAAPPAIEWRLDRLDAVGGHPTEVIGSPRVVDTPIGKAVAFDGARDGLMVNANPLEGLQRFTIEVLFAPDADAAEEQRFLHIQENGTENRAMMELRLAAGVWALDTYLRHGDIGLTLLDRARTHTALEWHTAALAFDGRTMTHYVDRLPQGSGQVAFPPLGPGRTSIGVRQNLVSFFKGRIALVRLTPDALGPRDLMRAAP